MQLTDLTQTLSSYSQQANEAVTAMSSGLRPMAFILLSICFLLELNNWKSMLNLRGQGMTRKLWIELAIKYVFAVILIMFSSVIADAILEIGNIIVKIIGRIVTLENIMYQFELGDIGGWIERMIIDLIGKAVQFIANVIIILLLLMRFIELYILKAIAPVLIAFFMSESLRSVTITFFKSYITYVLVTVLMLIVTVVFNMLANEDLLNLIGSVASGEMGIAFASLAKGIVYILMMAGIVRKAKQWIGVS